MPQLTHDAEHVVPLCPRLVRDVLEHPHQPIHLDLDDVHIKRAKKQDQCAHDAQQRCMGDQRRRSVALVSELLAQSLPACGGSNQSRIYSQVLTLGEAAALLPAVDGEHGVPEHERHDGRAHKYVELDTRNTAQGKHSISTLPANGKEHDEQKHYDVVGERPLANLIQKYQQRASAARLHRHQPSIQHGPELDIGPNHAEQDDDHSQDIGTGIYHARHAVVQRQPRDVRRRPHFAEGIHKVHLN
mmetsp:Transcript_126735/g.405804  ORF Transcript_126735/g.405804 Transcript_126735/m.405804 type:complete len:244 (+) Transcript_126735:560-1291(+)